MHATMHCFPGAAGVADNMPTVLLVQMNTYSRTAACQLQCRFSTKHCRTPLPDSALVCADLLTAVCLLLPGSLYLTRTLSQLAGHMSGPSALLMCCVRRAPKQQRSTGSLRQPSKPGARTLRSGWSSMLLSWLWLRAGMTL